MFLLLIYESPFYTLDTSCAVLSEWQIFSHRLYETIYCLFLSVEYQKLRFCEVQFLSFFVCFDVIKAVFSDK